MRKGDTKPHYKSVLQSKEVCDDILNYKANFKEKTWNIPDVIKNASKQIQAKYIQGIADSQGSVANFPTVRTVVLCSRNEKGKMELVNLLTNLGLIDLSVRKLGVFITSRRSLEMFSKYINFNIQRKKENLQSLINRYVIYKTPKWELTKLKPRIIELRKEGLSYSKIAKELSISTKSAWNHSKHIINY